MIIHSPIISGSLTFANGATFTLPPGGSYTGSFTGSFEGDGSNLSGVTSYTDSDTLIYINSLGILSSSEQLTTEFDERYLNTDSDGIVSQSSQIDGTSISNNSITIAGTSLSLGDSITYSTITNGTGTISQSAQLTEEFDTRYLNTNGDGIISQSSQVNADSITNFDVNVLSYNNTLGVISSSAQLTTEFDTRYLNTESDGIVSQSSQIDGTSISNNSITIAGTSVALGDSITYSTITNGTGAVSQSSQIDVTQTTNYGSINQYSDTKVKTKLNAEGVISASSQITITESQISDLDHYTDSDWDSRLATKSTTNLSEGTNLYYTDARVKTKLTAEGVISASSQITITESQISDLSHYSDSDVESYIRSIDVVSGSASQVRSFINVENGADVTDAANVTSGLVAATGISSGNKTTIQTNLGVDASGTDNSTDVTLANTNYLSISGQEITGGTIPIGSGGTGATSAGAARTALGVDAAGTDNSTDVTLAGSRDYITIVGQTITRNQIDISDDTNLAAGTGITLTGDTLSTTDSEIVHDNLSGFVANEHIDHTSVSITAGDGLTGGGTIAATRTIHVGAGTGVTVNANDISIGQAVGTSDNVTFNDLTVSGNLTVDGTTTSINTTNLNVTDKLIELNRGGSTAASADGGGLFISGANESLTWDNGNSRFTFSDDLNVGGNITVTGTVDGRDIATDGTKLDSIATNANNYSHPTFDGDDIDIDTTELTGATVISDLDFNITTDSNGHVTDANGTVSTRTLTKSNIGLGNVENTALSTWGGSSNITTVGTISTGTWQGTAIADAYLSSNTAHLSGTQTFSGDKTFSAAVNISNSTASTSKTTGALKVTGGVGISGALNVGGDVVAYASSDERLKDNIELISNPIEKVQSLKGVTWDWNENADELQQSLPNVGVIAQDVEKVLPQLVTDRDNGFKGVDYAKLTGLLIEAIKEQQKQIDELKSKIQ